MKNLEQIPFEDADLHYMHMKDFKTSFKALSENKVIPHDKLHQRLAKYSKEFHFIRVDVVRALSNIKVANERGDLDKLKKHYRKLKRGYKDLVSIVKRINYENGS